MDLVAWDPFWVPSPWSCFLAMLSATCGHSSCLHFGVNGFFWCGAEILLLQAASVLQVLWAQPFLWSGEAVWDSGGFSFLLELWWMFERLGFSSFGSILSPDWMLLSFYLRALPTNPIPSPPYLWFNDGD
ncbi:hypothetical protein SUGI_0414700 [Cryptomeria japonica]|nr:hypothetical protein SUGI_0414700 [Cryptomeria japonica]